VFNAIDLKKADSMANAGCLLRVPYGHFLTCPPVYDGQDKRHYVDDLIPYDERYIIETVQEEQEVYKEGAN
jgi:hypothetical protein